MLAIQVAVGNTIGFGDTLPKMNSGDGHSNVAEDRIVERVTFPCVKPLGHSGSVTL
jgi:hypothetical protein